MRDTKALIKNKINLAESQHQMSKNTELFIEQTLQFQELMMMYNSAIREIRTKLETLNDDLAMRCNRNPIEFITQRIKKPMSIIRKLKSRSCEISYDSIIRNLNDVAGIRVICSFIDDIYKVSDMLTSQDDITLIKVKDYIKNPKPNGYRSYHIIVEIPVFFSDRKENIRVEIQFRTIAMDFWASLEHKLKYKRNIPNESMITSRLYNCAEIISSLDREMLNIRNEIDANSEPIEDDTMCKLERLSNGLIRPNYN